MSKRNRRRERQVPGGQQQLGLEDGATVEEQMRPHVREAVKFKRGQPRLFVGGMPLKSYLEDAGLGWVVRMRALLEFVDVQKFVEQYEGSGRYPYHPRMILGLFLYGLLEKKWSLRELESLAARDVGAWWICEGLRPDHSTLGRFLVRHQDLITDSFFIDLAQTMASRLQLRAGEAVIDGTVIAAAASHLSTMKAEALKSAAAQAHERAASGDEQAAHKAVQLDEARRVCDERNAQREAKARLGKGAQVVPHEPEAVVQKQKDGSVRPSYKPTVMVHESGLVTGFHVDPTSETKAVKPLVEQHRAVFAQAPQTAMLDAGFFSTFVLSYLVGEGIEVLCPPGRAFDEASMTRKPRGEKTRFLKNKFAYDAERDVFTCPAQRLLTFESASHNPPSRRYRAESCIDCPLKAQCTDSNARTIKRYPDDDLKDAITQAMKQPETRERFKRRSCGERPFAGIKQRQGLTRFHRRGLRGARLETALHFAAWNIRLAVGTLTLLQITLWAPERDYRPWRFIAVLVVGRWTPV
jgi:transposase